MAVEAYYEVTSPGIKRAALDELSRVVGKQSSVAGLSDVAHGLFRSKDAAEHKDILMRENGVKLGLFLTPLNVQALTILERRQYQELRKFYILHQASREILNVLFPGTTREIIEKTRRAHKIAAPARPAALEESEERRVFETFYRLHKVHKSNLRTLYQELQIEHPAHNITTLFAITSTLPEMQFLSGIIHTQQSRNTDE